MPPLIEDEDSSDDQVNEIPATKPKKSEIDDNEEPDEDDDEDVDVDVDNEYEVEDVVGHKIVKGKLKFRIKWKGFEDPTDITTEPEDNLAAAQEIVQEYLDAHGGRKALLSQKSSAGPSSKKRKLEDSPHVTVTSNGKGRKKRAAATPNDSNSGVNVDRKNNIYPPGSWEDLVSNIDHIQEVLDPKTGGVKRVAFIHWNDGEDPLHTRHDLMTLYKKCPQKMLRYYESHLVFRSSAAPGAEDEIGDEAEAMAGSFENGGRMED